VTSTHSTVPPVTQTISSACGIQTDPEIEIYINVKVERVSGNLYVQNEK